jgi:hypothetical protein
VNHSWRGIFRLGIPAWLGACLLILAPGPVLARAASDPLGLDAAIAEVRTALEDMADAINGAPRQTQTAISADLHLTAQAIARALDRLDGGVPIADPTLVYDLNLLADIAEAATAELHAIARRPGTGLDPERARGIDRLTEAAAARLAEVNLVIDSWNERSRNAVIEVEDDGGALLVRSTDRLLYDGVRYVSIALLLIGLLALGLHLRAGHRRADFGPRSPLDPLLPALGTVTLIAFFASCLAFSLRPDILASLSAEVRVQAQEHPCERLASQRDRLIAAQEAGHDGLIEATEQRMRPAAQDCLGLPSAAMTAEAIKRLAAKTALARNEAAPGLRLTTAAPRRGMPGAPTQPAVPALEPAEMQASGSLAELLSNLRDAERTVADPTEPAVAPAEPAAAPAGPAAPMTEVAEAASGGPEPAAGPDQSAALEAPPEPNPAQGLPELKAATFVTTTALNYRDGPSVDARRLGTLVPGARLHVVGRDAGWAQVRLGDGRQAYVATEFLVPAP